MKITTVSAPGKLILFGEHVVVYGYPAIVAAINRRMAVTVTDSLDMTDHIDTGIVLDQRFVKESLILFKKKYNINSYITLKTSSQFSDRVGFGSSAAITVATIYALATHFKKPMTKDVLFDLSYQVVIAIQKKGSGADIAASIWGGIVYFQKNTPVQKLDSTINEIIVGYTGIKASTTKLIDKVSTSYAYDPKTFEKIFISISKIVKQAKKEIVRSDENKLGELMSENHTLLKKLKVSTVKLDCLVKYACEFGAYGGKLSGAGGGDCMTAIAPEHAKKTVKSALSKSGATVYILTIETEGVRIEL